MKAVFWLVGLAAAAVALALLMGQNGATVTLFWPPYRVDLSFNLVLAGVLLMFLLLHVALRSIAAVRALPGEARRWRQQQRERAAAVALVDAWVNQKAGRFVRARSAARQAVEQADALAAASDANRSMRVMARVMAADAEHALTDLEARDRHLQAAQLLAQGAQDPTVPESVQLKSLQWAVESGDIDAARRQLALLPQGLTRRTLVLRLKLRLSRLLHDPAGGYETARLLAKHRAFPPDAAASLLRQLRVDLLNTCADLNQLQQRWTLMDTAERLDPELILAALSRAIRLIRSSEEGWGDGLSPWVQAVVTPLMDTYATLPADFRLRFAASLQHLLPGSDPGWLARIEALQRSHPADPFLLFLAAQTFFQQKLWGKATTFFQQATRSLQDEHLLAESWARLAQLAQLRGDDGAALAAWEQAAGLALGRLPYSRTSL
jgi:HemY protein